MGSIRLSEKYGVNPSVGMCFWCGGDDGCIYLLGANKGREAPHRAVYTYEPCDKCKANMAMGITLMEIETTAPRDGVPPIVEGVWPTGRWVVLKEEVAERTFQPESFKQDVLRQRKAFVPSVDWKKLGLPT